VASAQLLFLQCPDEIFGGGNLPNLLRTMSNDAMDTGGAQLAGGINNVMEHGLASHPVENFRQRRFPS
jgi:hypothetical protein